MVVQCCTCLHWLNINHFPSKSPLGYICLIISMNMCGHLEQKTLKTTLPRENVILDVIVKTSPLEFQGLINGAFASITKS